VHLDELNLYVTHTHNTHTHTHTLQEALVHLEELKLREIAQERAMHMNNNLLTTKRIAENHRNRSLLTHTRSLLTHTRSLLTHTRSLLTHTRSLLTPHH